MARYSDKFGVKEVMDVTFYDLESFEPVLYIDTLKMSNLENTAEESEARGGRGNPILLTWDYNREANFTIQDALIAPDGLALLSGMERGDLFPGTARVYEREVITLAGVAGVETIVLQHEAIAADRIFVYDVYHGIAAGELTLDGVTLSNMDGVTEINIDAGLVEEVDNIKQVVVYYPYQRTDLDGPLQTITISSDDFPGYYRVVGDTLIRNARTGLDEPFQLVVHRAKILPGFTITMEAEGDPSVFDMNLKVMRPLDRTTMIEMTKYSDAGS